jgi:hypothetical protein
MLTSKLTLSIVAAQIAALDLESPEADLTKSYVDSFANGHIVEPGGTYFVSNPSAAGWAVVAATGDQLSVENLSASAAAYDVILIGK